MTISKKIRALLLAAAMVFTLSIPAFAVSGTKSVTGYGTLKGTLTYSSSAPKVVYSTSISKNPDNASVGYKIEYISTSGASLDTDSSYRAGVTSNGSVRTTAPSGTSTIYSTHEVKGGSKYAAQLLYLKLSL